MQAGLWSWPMSTITPSEILEKRLELGLTQTELAARAGVSMITISRIERGAHAPTRNTKQAIAAALGMTAVLTQGD